MTDFIKQFTSIGRSLDPRYPTHRLLMAFTLIAGIVAGLGILLGSGDFGAAVLAGFYAGASVFIAWVLARELDPDNDYAAFVAMALALIFSLGAPNMVVLTMMIIALRVVNRTFGPPARWPDSFVLLGLVAAGVFLANDWTAALVGALAFGVDALLQPALRRHWLFALASLVLMVAGIATQGIGLATELSLPYLLGCGLVALLTGYLWRTTTRISAPTDVEGYTVAPQRVQAAILIALAGAISSAIVGGDPAVLAMLPLWAALAGAAFYRVSRLLQRA